jgi:hypothetical protein
MMPPNERPLLMVLGSPVHTESNTQPLNNSKGKTRPCRKGLKPATCYITPEARRQIKKLAWEQEKTIENILREALDYLFAKNGLPEIAKIKGKGGEA